MWEEYLKKSWALKKKSIKSFYLHVKGFLFISPFPPTVTLIPILKFFTRIRVNNSSILSPNTMTVVRRLTKYKCMMFLCIKGYISILTAKRWLKLPSRQQVMLSYNFNSMEIGRGDRKTTVNEHNLNDLKDLL